MKIILSRKGFDSEYGGHPSPFIPGEKMCSFPIPVERGGIGYKEVSFSKDRSMKDAMDELGIEPNKGKGSCHLDPDIDPAALKRPKVWRGAFGQCDAAQGHLENRGVGRGDLFLFFGWFRRAAYDKNGGLKFIEPKYRGFHALFGYLFIDEVLAIGSRSGVPGWLEYHPHCENRFRKKTGNAIYTAKRSVADGLPGFGCFRASDGLILTKKGYSKSRWDLPKRVFSGAQISYHKKSAWKDGYFRSTGRGQEFVVEDDEKVAAWAMDLVKSHL